MAKTVTTPNPAQVEEKGTLASKINLTAIVTFLISVATMFGLDVSAEMQVKILGTVSTVGPVLTYIFRTWFTSTKLKGLI